MTKDDISKWVLAAMNANIMVQTEVLAGNISRERLAGLINGILDGAVCNILHEVNKIATPSNN